VPRVVGPLALVLLVLAAGGCSGGEDSSVAAHRAVGSAPPAPGRYLTRAELDTQLGNVFHRALYQVAVMSQPGDDAADLGQSLPTGQLRAVACAQGGERARWSCRVSWETVDAARETTAYRVNMNARGCFYASATPALPQRYDATIRSYSEHPLNQLQSLRRGCTG
jgi:hypothetical protein